MIANFTTQDLQTAAGLFAAAADKYASVSPDTVAYMNAILGNNTKTTGTITYSTDRTRTVTRR